MLIQLNNIPIPPYTPRPNIEEYYSIAEMLVRQVKSKARYTQQKEPLQQKVRIALKQVWERDSEATYQKAVVEYVNGIIGKDKNVFENRVEITMVDSVQVMYEMMGARTVCDDLYERGLVEKKNFTYQPHSLKQRFIKKGTTHKRNEYVEYYLNVRIDTEFTYSGRENLFIASIGLDIPHTYL